MAENSKIEWTDHTFNPWIGCTKISPACDNCYAEADFDKRRHFVKWGSGQPRMLTSAANWRKPLAWNKQHAKFFAQHGRRQRVFCASLADVFDNEVSAGWRGDLFKSIERTPNLDWLLLTKRIGNAWPMIDAALDACVNVDKQPLAGWPWPNVWLGATVCNQAEADRDIPKLLDTPAVKHFLSIEPMLGNIDLDPKWLRASPSQAYIDGKVTASMPAWTRYGAHALDWIICGGESGPKARPMCSDWVRSLRDQCAESGVPFFFKQWGEWGPHPHIGVIIQPTGTVNLVMTAMTKCGKKAAGRMLDDREHNEMPK
jgi:protein gp37